MAVVLHRVLTDLIGALTTFPDARGWLLSALALALFATLALWIGLRGGLLAFDRRTPLPRFTSILTLLHPAFTEELFFRGALIPLSRREDPSHLLGAIAVSLAAFIVWHPLNGWLLRKSARPLFASPDFLLIVLLLGMATTAAYLLSASLWPPVLIHWVTVWAWLRLFSGRRALMGDSTVRNTR